MKEITVQGKTIQEAVEKGLKELSLRRDQVEVVVVHEGKKGILGIGSKKAKVIIREKKWTGDNSVHKNSHTERTLQTASARINTGHDRNGLSGHSGKSHTNDVAPDSTKEVVKTANDSLEQPKIVLSEILNLMGISFKITEARYEQDNSKILVRFDSPDSYLFTHNGGRCLESLQFIVNLICNKNKKNRQEIQIDTSNYWDRTEKEIIRNIEFAVRNIKRTGRPYRLEPMPSNLRKFVHRVVKNSYPDMETISEGEGRWRKVVIRPVTNKTK